MDTVQTRRRPIILLAGVLALLLVMFLVLRTSQATFSATTENPDNTFNAAVLTLTDNRQALPFGALFDVDDMVPGERHEGCIEITYAGPTRADTPQAVKLYGSGSDSGLATSLALEVAVLGVGQTCATAAPSTSSVFGGTLAAFGARSDYANGLTGWAPAENDTTRAFRFSVQLDPDTADLVQGTSAAQTFTWEVRS